MGAVMSQTKRWSKASRSSWDPQPKLYIHSPQTQRQIPGLAGCALVRWGHQIEEVLIMALSDNLQFLRSSSGMTQEQLAELLDVSR